MSYKKQIIKYLKKNLSKGYTLESLKIALSNQGYSRAIIDLAVKELNKELANTAPVFKEKPNIKYQIVDGENNFVKTKKPFWRKILKK